MTHGVLTLSFNSLHFPLYFPPLCLSVWYVILWIISSNLYSRSLMLSSPFQLNLMSNSFTDFSIFFITFYFFFSKSTLLVFVVFYFLQMNSSLSFIYFNKVSIVLLLLPLKPYCSCWFLLKSGFLIFLVFFVCWTLYVKIIHGNNLRSTDESTNPRENFCLLLLCFWSTFT